MLTLTLNNETISKKSGGTTRNKRQNTQILKAGLSLTSSGTISFVVLAVGIATFTTTAIASYAVNVGFNSVHSGISYIKCEINTDNISYDDLLFYAQNENDASDIHETIPFLNDYKKPYVLFDELEPNTEYFISAKEKDTNKIYKIGSYSTLEIPYYNATLI